MKITKRGTGTLCLDEEVNNTCWMWHWWSYFDISFPQVIAQNNNLQKAIGGNIDRERYGKQHCLLAYLSLGMNWHMLFCWFIKLVHWSKCWFKCSVHHAAIRVLYEKYRFIFTELKHFQIRVNTKADYKRKNTPHYPSVFYITNMYIQELPLQ